MSEKKGKGNGGVFGRWVLWLLWVGLSWSVPIIKVKWSAEPAFHRLGLFAVRRLGGHLMTTERQQKDTAKKYLLVYELKKI